MTNRKPCRAEIRSPLSMLTVMDVTATELWVTAPASTPQPNPANRLLVSLLARIRTLGPATDFMFSDKSHMPKKSSPIPPIMPPNNPTIEDPRDMI